MLRRLNDRYSNPPMILTENGGAFTDVFNEDGQIDDQIDCRTSAIICWWRMR